MSDVTDVPDVIDRLATAIRAVPGVHRLYPTSPRSLGGVLRGAGAAALVLVQDGEATVTIGITDDVPAAETAARVHDVVVAAAVDGIDRCTVRIAQID